MIIFLKIEIMSHSNLKTNEKEESPSEKRASH